MGRPAKGFTLTLVALAISLAVLLGTIVFIIARYNHAIAEANSLRAEKQAAQERATALALLWAKSVDDAERKLAQERKEREQVFADLVARARSTPARPIAVAGSTLRLWSDVTRAANAASITQGSAAPADPVPEPAQAGPVLVRESDLAEYVTMAGLAYADAYGQWKACVEFYNKLRTEEQLH